MLNDKERSEMEQSIASLRELLPRMWRQLYEGLIQEGFTDIQSMDLLKTYIMSDQS